MYCDRTGTIPALTGAPSTTNGIVGYIPAPPAGTQNSYLRGDGTWQQAVNAAQYYLTTQPYNQGPYGVGSVFPFSTSPTVNTGGGEISASEFQRDRNPLGLDWCYRQMRSSKKNARM